MEIEELLEDDFDEASDEADNDYQYLNDPSSTQPSSGPPSTPNSCASSPPVSTEEPISPQRNFYTSILSHGGNTLVFSSGKPYGPKRGPGRPRKEFAPGLRHTKDIRGVIRKCRGGIMKGTKKKFLGKDERNALLALSQENGFLQGPSKSPSDFSNGMLEMTGGEVVEKNTSVSEDVPYFLEKWPGKVCALCNLGERSQLGQGEMLRLEINELGDLQNRSTSPGNDEKESSATDVLNNNSAFPQFSNRRQKGLNKCKNPVNTSDYVDELEKIGYVDPVELSSVQDSNYYYVHRQCVTWSFGILTDPTEAIDKVTLVISQSLRRKCAYCNRYGASITCKMSCPKVFHFPCVSASGGFQIIQTYASFCKEHLGQVSLVCSDDVNCRSCSMLGDVSNLVMCSICGDHYHGTCIGLAQLPGVRAGWQCVSCRKCQICRTPEVAEGRSLPCEQCHKVYHASCLRPVMSSIPKYGWKCRRCRVCSDCGSRTPGAGASSRWHAHYTVCDSCYQQRNKGFSCPICHRAYRAAAYREMVKCSCCNKFVHSTCDPDADLASYHAKKESNPEYEYICSPCKMRIQSGRHTQLLMRRNSHLDEDNTLSAQENLYTDEKDSEFFEKNLDFGLGKGKPFSASKIAKKRMGFPFGVSGRAKGKVGFQKKLRSAEFGRKRGPKTKMRGIFGVPGLGLQRPTSIESLNAKNEDEPGIENRLVLCSAKDKFILTQDICVMCGAIGTDHEGCLIACTQCGQCYHPYCVNVKVTKVILKKGWRCLDCTVCEGCGQKNDEARLILCDECDISFHIYCMDPPLDIVPQGNWKCKWCAICQKCGKNSPGKNCSWKNSYSECAPCASQLACAVCSENYVECELIIQCLHCERWLHCKCDSIKNEEEAEKCDEAGYVCILCRPKDTPPPHLMPSKKIQAITSRLAIPNITNSPEQSEDSPILQGLDGTHFLDGVCLSEHGISLIKSLQMEHIRKKRKQKLQDVCINNKDARISAAIESVVAGSGIENVIDDTKVEPLDPKEEAEIYKDGMVWDRSDASPPDGFALCTNEQGVVVLRKKRQRNLQKLGIGGFNVRNRTARKDGGYKDDAEEHVDHTSSYINDNHPSEKKKKNIRKRHKSKLTETYPAYLQEAFFGKNLLDTNKISFESESSEDDAKSSVSEDKIIKLSPEELKMLDCMKTEIKMEKAVQLDENQSTNKIRSMNSNAHVHKQNLEDDIENGDQDPLKDILPQDLLDSDLVNSIMNDGNELTKTSGSLGTPNDEGTATTRKDDLADILNCPNFNLDSIEINSKDVEEIFQDVIDTDAKMPLLEKRDRNVISPKQSSFQTSTNEAEFSADSTMAKMKPKIVNNFVTVAPTFAANNANVKLVEQSQSKPNISQTFMPIHDQSSNSPIPFGSCQVGTSWQTNSRPCDTSVSQNEEAMSGTPTTQANQKSSERMRRDEDLGKMATISAVLYANTNHPELKQDYPNWPDRCKQIYKRWRALSSEKKAPFLQQARDNRSALRMKKVQQAEEAEKDLESSTDIPGSVCVDSNDNNDEDNTSVLSSCSSIDNEKSIEGKDFDENSSSSCRYISKNEEKKTERNTVSNQVFSNIHPVRCKLNFVKNASVQAVSNKSPNENSKETQVKKPSLHKFYISSNLNGPAPNVTVNANGAFNTGSKAVLHTYCATRPIANHFLLMNKNPQKLSIDFSAIGIPVQKDRPVVIKNIASDTAVESNKNKVQLKNRNLQTILTSEVVDENGRKSSITPIYLDQNIRVLTPSEIMKTLPIIPGQDTTLIAENSSSSACNTTLDHEKITTQQKSLKQQEQERQWKQLQAQRAKEQQLQQFTTQVPRDNSTPNSNSCSNSSVSFSPEQNVSIEKRPVFNPIPGTPRPQFNTDIVQSTVYASQIDAYPNTLLPLSSAFAESSSSKQQENKQLRDLLQRQEDATVHTTQNRTISSPAQTLDNGIQRWNQDEQTNITNQSFNFSSNSTFREPFPVATTNRTIKVVGNSNLPRMNTASNVMRLNLPTKKPNIDSGKRQKKTKDGSGPEVKSSDSLVEKDTSNKTKSAENIKSSDGEIPDNVTAELEKLEQEENVVMSEVEGVGDILGGLGEDDDDELLNSLTAEMGAADFNILEYADPELDALTDNVDNNLLDRLDFDEGDPDERLKKAVAENKYFVQRHEQMQIEKQALQSRPASGQSEGEQAAIIKNRTDFILRKDQSSDIQRASNFICAQNFGVNRSVVDVNSTKLQDSSFRPTTLPRYNSTITGAGCKVPRATLPPPPPPYPGPPPPYPVNSSVRHNQDQPLLLEDLLEQEKREQQQMSSTLIEKNCGNQQSSPYQKVDARAPTTTTQNWRKKIAENDEPKKAELSQVQFFSANLQPPPPAPPDVIVSEQDRILQINYENWLNNQNIALTNKLKYYEDEVFKLRKIRKSLNSKQRSVKKTGGELSPQDAMDLVKVTSEQAVVQKHLENSRKHSRQHAMLFQEYRSKHMAKVPVPSSSTPSPAQMSSMSPMLSPSTNSQSSMLMQTSPSPLGGHILQCTKSPLHSPSPLISHSPSGISQSPVHQSNSNASPYNTMQSSPRISTPHSHIDENSFSPSATIPSPSSLPGRHASPAPRITSPQNPQNRMAVTQMSAVNRIATSPGASFGSNLQSQQQVKYNQDRVRMQMPSQHMHQNISPLGSPQPIVSPTQIHSFANSQEVLQSQRTMHFIQQRQIIQQRQHANQNSMKPKGPTASSPIQTHGMGSSPSSPLLQYNPVSNQSILINSLSNRRPNSENSSNDQYSSLTTISHDQILSQNRETVQSSDQHNQQQNHFIRSNSEGSGSGGGLSSLTGSYLPIVEPQGKYGRIRLGLFGGSPMWNISNIRHKMNIETKPRILETRDIESKSGSSSSETTEEKTCAEKKSTETPMSGGNILNSGNVNVSSRSNTSVESTSKTEESSKTTSHVCDDVVVIDSSPDEKQGIMDYDDFHDKGFVATEVSLNSAAQHIADGDDMTVIESLVTPDLGEIVTSPLESEVTEEYVLFSTDVVDYVDSDDSLKPNTIPQKNDDTQIKSTNSFEKDFEISLKKKEKFEEEKRTSGNIETVVSEKNAAVFTMDSMNQIKITQKPKIPEVKNFATTEDFEAMIDGRSTKEPIKIFENSSNVITTSTAKTISTAGNFIASNLLTCGRTTFTSVQCNVINATSTPSTAVMVTPKKIVTDVAQTTAKVSIGNTTISVPLLKNMNLNSAHIMSPEKQTKVTGNINIAKQPTILNVRGQKINTGKIVSLSSLQLKSASNAGNAKIVQATVLGNKIQLPQTTVDGFANIKHSIMQPFSYPKLSSLTVLQDMSLPNKIFEDESISPDSSVEQEESEVAEIKDYKLSKHEGTVTSQIKESSNIIAKKEDSSEKHSQSDKIKEEQFAKLETNSENQKIATRVISIMPQLSPLSQPTELTTNMANVSQQLRTIMSSINSSNLQMEKKSQEGSSSNQNQHNSDSGSLERHNQLNDKDIVIKSIISEAESGQKGIPSSLTAMKVFLTTTKSSSSSLSVEKAKLMLADDKHMAKKTKLVVPSSMFPPISTALEIPCTSRVSPTSTTCASIVTTCSQDTQATKAIILSSSNIKRSKSIDETVERDVPAQISGLKRYSLEVIPNKSDTSAIDDSSTTTSSNENFKNQEQVVNGCKTSNVTSQNIKPDESQNVLLKQLLQNSTTSTSSVNPQGIPARKVPALRAPSLGVVSSLEAQLARPVIPPVPTSPPSLLQSQQHIKLQTSNEHQKTDKDESLKKISQSQIVSRETSFVSNPVVKNLKQSHEKSGSGTDKPTGTSQEQQRSEHLTVKLETFIENNKMDRECSSPLVSVKKEVSDLSLLSRLTSTTDDQKNIKREFNESPPLKKNTLNQTSCASQGDNMENCDMPGLIKEEKTKVLENFEANADIKKKKKREYQKNRRQQLQMLSKETTHLKKRSRKLSKFDEDYDNFIDNLMIQLRQMQQMQVLEPLLSRNYGICPPYGAGDLSKVFLGKEQNPSDELLHGEYGVAKSKNYVDYYNTKPFGSFDMPPEPCPTSMHNGFYDQEFPPIKFESDFDQGFKFDSSLKDRDIDTPESIVTSSSPECVLWDTVLPFPGLRVINEDSKEDSEYGRMSPVVPVIAPIPIKLQAGMDLSIDKISSENNKENTMTSEWRNKSKHILTPKDSNVTVTLTLTSSAAEDIMGVLRDLANILHIPPPTSYQIVERTTTPPSQKLGLYRTKGKDGKEGDPVDIQTILNGAAKFCRHCDVVILNTIIRAKACEFPLLSANNEFLNGSDDLYFCSKSCYKQFKWRPTNILDDSLHSVNSSAGNISKFDGKMSNAQFTIKTEKMDEDDEEMLKDLRLRGDLDVKSSVHNNVDNENCLKKYIPHNAKVSNELIPKTSRYKYFSHSLFASPQKYKKPTDKEITEMLFRMNITVTPAMKLPEDTRKCIFCSQSGDGVADGPSRLLNFDVDKWVHLNCALWSDGVYETVNGALMNLEAALQGSLNQTCTLCHQLGATIKCFKNRCGNVYHLSCAIKDNCVFYKNKTTHCLVHALKNEKENELTTLSVQRRVYVDRDESRQVAAVMHHSELSNLLRVGSLIFLNVGQLLPHQLQAFHNSNYIYPIGYKIIRFYWSMRKPNKRCRYICSIGDDAGRPEFRVLIKEHSEQDIELKDSTPKAVWQRILEPLALLRKNCELVQLFPKYVTGEDLFGLTEPAVVRILESLPGIETLTDYRFKYGRNPLLELPLAINPSGAARTEPKQKQALGWRKPHTQRSGSTNQRLPLTPTISVAGEVACPYSKQFVHSKSSQYKKMKQEWRNNVFLARSKIQGLGLYAARDLEKHTMVIEYIGEVIRKEVSELREKQYEAKNRGIYMFRLDEERVVDATLSGGLARYINHSCNPNCVTEIVEVDREYRIIIFAKRRINRGEELSYDYKFDIEDDAHKISCMCGAPNCRKWMN